MDKHDIDRLGYDLEELYFARLNQELIRKLRDKQNRERFESKSRNAEAEFWMRCPKCGEKLEEISVQDAKIERCTGCRGVFFDALELAIFLREDHSLGTQSRS